VFDEGVEEYTESVCNAIEDEVAHEACENDDPTPTTIGWGWKLDQGDADVIVVKWFVLDSPISMF
jgi:hypothetical protein